MAPTVLENKALSMLQRLCAEYACETPKSSFNGFTYSTAWVSMIRKPSNGVKHWLFPQAFSFILEHQLEDGSWRSFQPSDGRSAPDIDSIVNTLAALLALLIRRDTGDGIAEDLDHRIQRGDAALRKLLQSWDITSSDTVAFELVVPAHLEMLDKYNLRYDFPARGQLMKIHQQRMNALRPEHLYGNKPSTVLYCLETMIGKLDFDRLAHHQTLEAFIEAFPKDVIMSSDMIQLANFLEETFHAQKGLIGWAPGMILNDSDDTSAVIYILNYLGRVASPDAMIRCYESSRNFRTFAEERTTSTSANAHILKSLLHVPDASKYTIQIIKAAEYLCESWLKGNATCKY
ncbi:MAG: hypothetical protein Q9224_005490, partial [Gallowayella concinna]